MKKEINPEYLACPIRQVISRFGDKWSMLVLYALDRSDTGVMRFSELHAHMSDCSQKMLSKTLKGLQESRRGAVAHSCHRTAHRLGQKALRRGGQAITVAIMLQCCFCHFFEVTKLIA